MAETELTEETIAAAKEYLKKKGVLKKYINGMTFRLVKSGDKLAVSFDGSERFVISGKNDNIQKIWKMGRLSDKECADLLSRHPQRELIEKLECEAQKTKYVLKVYAKIGIPYSLKSDIEIPYTGKNPTDSTSYFTEINLISGASNAVKKEACSLIEDIYNADRQAFNTLRIPSKIFKGRSLDLFNGKFKLPKDLKQQINGDSIVFSAWAYKVEYSVSTGTFSKVKDPYEEIIRKLKSESTYVNRIYDLSEKFKNDGEKIKSSCTIDVNTLSSSITVQYFHSVRKYNIEKDSADLDIELACMMHEKCLQQDDEFERKEAEKRKNELISCPFYGSMLAERIIEIVKANKAEGGIPQSYLINKVRGLKTDLYANGLSGWKFSLFSDDEVKNMIWFMIDKNLLVRKQARNQYTAYYKLLPGKDHEISLIFRFGECGSYKKYNDFDWRQEIKNPNPKWNDKDILCILDHPAVYCVEPDHFVEYFSSAPDDVKEYIKIMSKMGDKRTKKICKAVCAGFKKEEKDAGEALEAKGE